ncbi:c-type cytochrome biogenesis protein CcmI [Thiocystis violacea]|uniref:c-type cytochrome biogenesis protein CcmI n=1 Tax=Thiocystis violacea TaxID=13725 RepID=UPI0019053AE0|nr:c-type cytochrome biogenesis protein CcmI [Thiocystis violacea]MBK1723116.1 c-type cytochrome biogenesis protein CcmI [Thiocystis violacea]
MIIFWILAGGLLVLALVFILAPLLGSAPANDAIRQDALNLEVFRQRLDELDADLQAGFLEQDRYDAARHDLERELLYDVGETGTPAAERGDRAGSRLGHWILGTALAIALPLGVVLLYLQLGEPRLIDPLQAGVSEQGAPAAEDQSAASLEELVQRLEDRLKENPDNIEGWLMLGRTYFATGQTEQGLKAIGQAYALAPDQVEVKLAYAEALAAASPNKSLDGQPAELIQAVLEQEPENRIARWLSGMIAFQKGQYDSAVTTWKAILAELDQNGDEAANLKQMVAEAQTRAGIAVDTAVSGSADTPPPAEAATSTSEPAAAVQPTTATDAGVAIQVAVRLDDGLADKAAPDDTVFVFARAASGPPMPLAVQRLQVKDLPKTLTLDDSMAMTPAMRLSAFDQVVVGARVSKSGQAMPQPGDLFGETSALAVRDGTETEVLIDQLKP